MLFPFMRIKYFGVSKPILRKRGLKGPSGMDIRPGYEVSKPILRKRGLKAGFAGK